MTEKEEMQILQLITMAGGAKSAFMEALYKTKEGKYDEASEKIKEGEDYALKAHRAHAEILSSEDGGPGKLIPLVLAHAEDQMMSAECVKILVDELIDVYKRFNNN